MRRARVLDDAQLKKVFLYISGQRHADRNRCVLATSHFAGMRIGEIAALKLNDVLDPNGQLRDRISLRAAITKGGHARVVFIGSKLRKELKAYAKTLPPNRRPSDPLIVSQKGRAFSPNSLCQLVTRIYKSAGIYGATSHSGRRTFISRLANGGIALPLIMRLAGHRQLATTQIYVETNDDALKNAVEVL